MILAGSELTSFLTDLAENMSAHQPLSQNETSYKLKEIHTEMNYDEPESQLKGAVPPSDDLNVGFKHELHRGLKSRQIAMVYLLK